MRIAVFADRFYPEIMAGSGRVAYELAKKLAADGHELTIFTRRWDASIPEREDIAGVNVYRYHADTTGPLKFAKSIRKTVLSLFREAYPDSLPDIVHIHLPAAATAIWRELKAGKISSTYFFYLPWKKESVEGRIITHKTIKEKIRSMIIDSMERQIIGVCDKIVVFNRFSHDLLIDKYKINSKTTITESIIGVDFMKFIPSSDKMFYRIKLNLPTDKKIVISLRSLEIDMGVDNLIEAHKRLIDDNENTLLLLAGKGSYESELKNSVRKYGLENNCIFTGWIPEESLADYYRASDVAVIPAIHTESFGLQIAEALASGVPAIATPVGSVPELLRKLDPRLICASTAPESIYATIKQFFAIPLTQAQWSDKCNKFAIENFSWQKLAELSIPTAKQTEN